MGEQSVLSVAALPPEKCQSLDWAAMSLLLPHCAIRWATNRLLEAVDGLAGLEAGGGGFPFACGPALRTWYNEYFVSFLYEHHQIEEMVFFPWVNAGLLRQGVAEIPERIVSQRVSLVKSLDSIDKVLKDVARSCIPSSSYALSKGELMMRLQKEVKMFSSDLFMQLDEEETHIIPLLRGCFSAQDVKAKNCEIINSCSMEMAKKNFPWMHEALKSYATKEVADAFYHEIPPAFRFMMWASWDFEHAQSMKGVIEGLAHGEARRLESEPSILGCCAGNPL
mmetsp:Transcript_57518/g.134834  ORF Transcript_57518/g.134834 Transcript_57518/m.134834 type:complete len:280 (-) Transcript_57518:53-892(-)